MLSACHLPIRCPPWHSDALLSNLPTSHSADAPPTPLPLTCSLCAALHAHPSFRQLLPHLLSLVQVDASTAAQPPPSAAAAAPRLAVRQGLVAQSRLLSPARLGLRPRGKPGSSRLQLAAALLFAVHNILAAHAQGLAALPAACTAADWSGCSDEVAGTCLQL